jgi:putative membrane protein
LIRKVGTTVVFLGGVALAVILALHAGLQPTAKAIAAVGWGGLAQLCAVQMISVVLCGLGWWAVTEGASAWSCLLSRWIRDGATNLLGFIPAMGEGVSARALALLAGSGAGAAAASTIVDVAVESLSQAIYTVVAFLLLFPHLGVDQAPKWALIVAASVVPVIATVLISRHRGALHWAQKMAARVAKLLGIDTSGHHHFSLADAVHAVYRRPVRVITAFLLHLVAWTTGAVQIWMAGHAIGAHISLADGLALHGLICAARSSFFLVPYAAGVQEGAFILVGAVLHLSPAQAIALSFILRGRDVLLGAPPVVLWYLVEARRKLRRPKLTVVNAPGPPIPPTSESPDRPKVESL